MHFPTMLKNECITDHWFLLRFAERRMRNGNKPQRTDSHQYQAQISALWWVEALVFFGFA